MMRAEQLVAELHLLLRRLTTGGEAEALEQTCVAACRILAAEAATVMLVDEHGHLSLAAASDARARRVASLQCRLGQGPVSRVVEDGRPVVVDDLEREADRGWDVTATVLLAGLRSVVAVPLHDGDTPLGSLDLYGREALSDPEWLEAAQVLADAVACVVVVGSRQRRAQEVVAQLEGALERRVVVEQAKGMLAERLGLPPEEAYEHLRRHARDHNSRVSELARTVLAGEDLVPR
jgi:GAF domain-containing protein